MAADDNSYIEILPYVRYDIVMPLTDARLNYVPSKLQALLDLLTPAILLWVAITGMLLAAVVCGGSTH